METKEAECLFSIIYKGDSVIQLRNGKLIFYYFKRDYVFYIYNEKTFQNLIEINIKELIKKYKNKKDISSNSDQGYFKSTNNKNSIKELHDGLLLIGRDNILIQLKINFYEKTYEHKIEKEFNDKILDINELTDK